MESPVGANAGGAAGAGAAAAAHQARIQKMVGPVAFCAPETFAAVASADPRRAVVWSHQGWFSKKYHYITTASGLTWYCKSAVAVHFPAEVVQIPADKIMVPE